MHRLCTAALARRFLPTPRHIARGGIGATKSAKTLMGGMADKRLKSHPYRFGVGGGPAHGACLLQELFVNVERLLHMDDLAISFQPKQPDGPTGRTRARASWGETKTAQA
jgi:hypothetical protein